MLVISIVLEAVVAIIAILAARKGKPYLYGLAFTFGAYVLYDHAAPPSAEPRLNSVAFTMVIDKQDGRRFSGTFSSARGNEKFVAVISRNSTILLVDDDGYTVGSILAPNRIELCYMHLSQATRLASCAEMSKEP
jgi:hypothetical protein